MKRLTVFRILLLLFVGLFVAALWSLNLGDLSWCPELHEYQENLDIRFGGFNPVNFIWNILLLSGYLVELIGLLLLFCRFGVGIWPACVGRAINVAVSWCASYPGEYPNLRTTGSDLLWAATCVVWGAVICMAFVDRQELFGRRHKAEGVLP